MANVLNREKQDQVLALGRLGLRRIEKATGVRRETASAYLRAAGIAVRPAGRWGRAPPNPANEVTADLKANSSEVLQLSNPANEVTADSRQELAKLEKSFAAPYRDFIEEQLARGRNAFGIYQQLVDTNGFHRSYESVKRFVRTLRKSAQPRNNCAQTMALNRLCAACRRCRFRCTLSAVSDKDSYVPMPLFLAR